MGDSIENSCFDGTIIKTEWEVVCEAKSDTTPFPSCSSSSSSSSSSISRDMEEPFQIPGMKSDIPKYSKLNGALKDSQSKKSSSLDLKDRVKSEPLTESHVSHYTSSSPSSRSALDGNNSRLSCGRKKKTSRRSNRLSDEEFKCNEGGDVPDEDTCLSSGDDAFDATIAAQKVKQEPSRVPRADGSGEGTSGDDPYLHHRTRPKRIGQGKKRTTPNNLEKVPDLGVNEHIADGLDTQPVFPSFAAIERNYRRQATSLEHNLEHNLSTSTLQRDSTSIIPSFPYDSPLDCSRVKNEKDSNLGIDMLYGKKYQYNVLLGMTTKKEPTSSLSSASNDESESCDFSTDGCNEESSGGPSTQVMSQYYEHKAVKKGRGFGCAICGRVFPGRSKLQAHIRSHTGEKPFGCSVCGKNFSDQSILVRHMKSHSGEKPFDCEVCGKSFGRRCTLQVHMKIHYGERPHKCTECDKCFYQNSDLQTHLRIHRGEKPFECSMCDKAFADRSVLRVHIRTHTGEKPHECPICGKAFADHSACTKHIKSHSGIKDFSCPLCGKAYSRNTTLKSHMRQHKGEDPLSCPTCGKVFFQLSYLQKHEMTHTGDKPFECGTCGKAFLTKGNLERHMLVHTGEKPHVCNMCGKAFAIQTHLQRHIKSHLGEKPYRCVTCGKEYSCKISLKKHVLGHALEAVTTTASNTNNHNNRNNNNNNNSNTAQQLPQPTTASESTAV